MQRDLQVAAVVGDVLAGRPVVYTTFLAYDEVAHHSGVERRTRSPCSATSTASSRASQAAVADAPRPYQIVVLSDHGQSQGATFLQRYGITLEQLVALRLRRRQRCRRRPAARTRRSRYLSAGLTEVARDDTATGATVRARPRASAAPTAWSRSPRSRREIERRARATSLPELSVMASGCLGLISFPREPGRVTLERLEELTRGWSPRCPTTRESASCSCAPRPTGRS